MIRRHFLWGTKIRGKKLSVSTCTVDALTTKACLELDVYSKYKIRATPVPEIIDIVFAKTSPKRSFSMTEYERFGLVFMKTRVYKFGTGGAQVMHQI